jgi:hypothetical protein
MIKKSGNFTQTINNHKNGQGCKQCAGLEKPTILKLINDFKKIHGETYDYSKVIYVSAHKKIIIKCLKHGVFNQTPNNHKNGNGCPTCNESLGEKKIRVFFRVI